MNNIKAYVHFENGWAIGYEEPIPSWKETNFSTEFFVNNVYPVLGSISTFQVDRSGVSTATLDENEWFLIEELNTENLINEISDPVIKAEVKRRYEY